MTSVNGVSFKICGVCSHQLIQGICPWCGWAEGEAVWMANITPEHRDPSDVFVIGQEGTWEAARITIDDTVHRCRIDPPGRGGSGIEIPFWGLRKLNHRQNLYPQRPPGTTMVGVRSNPPCSAKINDPKWTTELGHGDHGGRECCMAVLSFVLAMPEYAIPEGILEGE